MNESWKTINKQKYDPETMGNFYYLGKYFKNKLELKNNIEGVKNE